MLAGGCTGVGGDPGDRRPAPRPPKASPRPAAVITTPATSSPARSSAKTSSAAPPSASIEAPPGTMAAGGPRPAPRPAVRRRRDRRQGRYVYNVRTKAKVADSTFGDPQTSYVNDAGGDAAGAWFTDPVPPRRSCSSCSGGCEANARTLPLSGPGRRGPRQLLHERHHRDAVRPPAARRAATTPGKVVRSTRSPEPAGRSRGERAQRGQVSCSKGHRLWRYRTSTTRSPARESRRRLSHGEAAGIDHRPAVRPAGPWRSRSQPPRRRQLPTSSAATRPPASTYEVLVVGA